MGTVKEQLWFIKDNYVYHAGSIRPNGSSPSAIYIIGNHLNPQAVL